MAAAPYRPPFAVTPAALEAAGDVMRLVGKYEGLDQPTPQPTLRRGNQIRTVVGSVAIEGNTLSIDQVTAMLDVLGLNPADPAWGPAKGADEGLTNAVDALVRGLLDQRAAARAAKDWAAADAVRDQLKAAGIEITDTPDGPKWSL